MRWHGTLHPCYGVFSIKGHHELHTQGGASRKCGGMGHCTHVMVFLILKVTTSCLRLFGGVALCAQALHTKCGAPKKGGAITRRSLQKGSGMGHCTHVTVVLILRVTMRCIQKAEPPERRWHGTLHTCYGVFNIKGHNELHTQGGASRNAVEWDIAPMLWCF